MMVDQALAETLPNTNSIKGHPLISSTFDLVLDDQTYSESIASLYNDFLLLKIKKHQETVYLKVSLNFDLIFELVREAETEEGTKVLKDPTALKFERFEKSFLLKNSKQPKELFEWRDKLEVRINQRGFHELFRPIKKVGKGNFATVYLVIKHQDGKKYAVKAFSKEGTYSEDKGKESLVNQVQIMRKFNHKNLMRLYGVFQSQNSIYVSVELLEGGQLYDKIKGKHKFTPVQIKTVMKGILEGLEVMHAQRIMHRDLKPENILLRKQNDFDCVIADFGLAEHSDGAEYMFVRCGTPGYVAPEVVNLKDLKAKYDPICDLFSVGVIFHLLALRKSPFPGKEYDEVLSQNRACKFNFESTEYQQLPQAWLNLMKRLLEKDPKKRITATEALNHEFFSKDQHFSEFSLSRHNSSLYNSKEHISEQEKKTEGSNSPLMMTRDNSRKNPQNLRDDSCLKFKMKENVMTGRTDQHGEAVEQIDSPALKKKNPTLNKNGESRFKKMAVKE